MGIWIPFRLPPCRWGRSVILTLALLLPWGGVGAQEESDPLPHAEQVRLADGLFSRGLYALALEEYNRLLTLDPPPDALDLIAFRAGECARALDQQNQALRLYLRVVALGREGDTLLRARLRLSELTFSLKKYGSTLAHTQAILEADPPADFAVPSLYLQGQSFAALQRKDEAIQTFQRLRTEWSGDPLAAYAALELARLESDPAKTDRLYEAAARNAPSPDVEIEALWGLFRSARERGDLKQAADRGWGLWQQHPDGARVRQGLLTLAWTQLQAGRHAQAWELSRAATPKQREVQPDTWLFLDARCAVELEKTDEAVKFLQALLTSFPDSRFRSLAAYELAALHAAAGRHAEVIQLTGDLKGIPGREQDVEWLLAESARATGDVNSALKRYDAIDAQAPPGSSRGADAGYLRALVRDQKKNADAAPAYSRFAQRFPSDERAPGALHRAGALWLKQGNAARAYDLWTRALEMYPQQAANADILVQLAAMDAKAERNDLALKRVGQALTLTKDPVRQSDLRYRMGLLHERSGRMKEAVTAYQQALEKAPDSQAVTLRLRLGVLLQKEGDTAEAVDVLTPLVTQSPDVLSDPLLLWLFRMSEDGEFDLPAVGIAEAMMHGARGKGIRELGFYLRARLYRAGGESEAAVEKWKQGLALGSKSTEAVLAHLNLADTLLELNRPEEAKPLYGGASALASSLEAGRLQARAMMGVGDAESARGQPAEAARMYLGVAVLYQDAEITPLAVEKAAAAYRAAGMPGRAEEILKKYAPPTPQSDEEN